MDDSFIRRTLGWEAAVRHVIQHVTRKHDDDGYDINVEDNVEDDNGKDTIDDHAKDRGR